jgi:uncharacterized protein (TIGR02466 family)
MKMCKAGNLDATEAPLSSAPAEVRIEASEYFQTAIYVVKAPQFLDVTRSVVTENLSVKKKEIKKLNEIYPLIMTDNLFSDLRTSELSQFIAQIAWTILDGQGYAMQELSAYLTDFWCQEHHKHSGMEQHVHGYGAQLSGFYFIDVPKDSSRVLFHDPKAGKVQINLREKDMSQATYASNVINFAPEAGTCMFANSWLAHSFTRHAANKPMRFIHFNVSVQPVAPTACAAHDVEVI